MRESGSHPRLPLSTKSHARGTFTRACFYGRDSMGRSNHRFRRRTISLEVVRLRRHVQDHVQVVVLDEGSRDSLVRGTLADGAAQFEGEAAMLAETAGLEIGGLDQGITLTEQLDDR